MIMIKSYNTTKKYMYELTHNMTANLDTCSGGDKRHEGLIRIKVFGQS